MTQDPFIPGQFYHVYNRANGGDLVFYQKRNYEYFLRKFKDSMLEVFDVLAYCLLPNHFHFLVRTKESELIKALITTEADTIIQISSYSYHISARQKSWLSGYAQAINKQEERKGSLFMHNTKRKLIWDPAYLMNVLHYIHLNPLHHGYVSNIDRWPYSSYKALVDMHRRTWLRSEEVIGWFGGVDNFITSHAYSSELALDKRLER